MTEHIHRVCPACGSADRTTKGQKNGFDILVCRFCRSIYTGHVPAAEQAEDYDGYYGEANLAVPAFIQERLGEILASFAKYRKLNRLLDIGFGAGTLLEIASLQKWQPYGLEVSKPAIEQARSRGFEVFHGSLSDAPFPANHFDVITASEILEHLPDPVSDLAKIATILRPGGLFWATTPSAKSLSFRILKLDWSILSPPEHIQLYSADGAMIMLKNAGFSSVKFRTLGLNPLELLNYIRNGRQPNKGFDRVQTGYKLNESLTNSRFRKKVKAALNLGLDKMRIGDSLKIFAEK
jgi:SAM-dependent methyltransferase